MGERQEGEEQVVTGDLQCGIGGVGDGEEIVVAEHDPLGTSGGTGGVDD